MVCIKLYTIFYLQEFNLQEQPKPSAQLQLEALFARVSLHIEGAAIARTTVTKESHSLNGGLYIISVAAKMLSMHPQTLRKYERIGLVRPTRTEGMLRLYSDDDIEHLRMIKYLVDYLGLNLAGVETVLYLVRRLSLLRDRVKENKDVKTDFAFAEFDKEISNIFKTLRGSTEIN